MEFKNAFLQKGMCPVCRSQKLGYDHNPIEKKAGKQEVMVHCNGCGLDFFAALKKSTGKKPEGKEKQ